MKPVILISSIAAAGLLAAGCATSTGTRTSELESLKTQVASLEAQVGQLNSQVAELSKQGTAGEDSSQDLSVSAHSSGAKASAALTGRQVQLALKKAGFYSGPVDGKLGRQTRKAVKAFQRSNGLAPDGRVGTKTSMALAKFLDA